MSSTTMHMNPGVPIIEVYGSSKLDNCN